MPLFSIIIPTFNSQATIKECIDSILRQNFNDFEVIIQDGMSKDNTVQVIENYSDKRIRIFVEKDTGVYDAMNKAIDKATGQWLYFLGSDDSLYDENVLAFIKETINECPNVNFVYGNVFFTGAKKIYDGAFDRLKLSTKGNIGHQAIFYKNELFTFIGNYNTEFKIWADWDFNVRCFAHPFVRPYYANIIVANYDESGGLSGKNGDVKLEEILPLDYKNYQVIAEFQRNSLDFRVGKKIVDILRLFKKKKN